MKIRTLGATLCLLFCAVSAHAVRIGDVKGSSAASGDSSSLSFDEDETHVRLIPAVGVGYNKLLTGYDGYTDVGSASFDLYIQPSHPASSIPTRTKHNMLFRLSVDYFPLEVPKGNLGLKEDMYAYSLAFVYQFHRLGAAQEQRWLPFISIGLGRYVDMVKLDTAATGSISRNRNYTGLQGSVGLALPWFGNFPLRLVPEIRYHRVKVVDNYATNIVYQIAVAYWPKGKR